MRMQNTTKIDLEAKIHQEEGPKGGDSPTCNLFLIFLTIPKTIFKAIQAFWGEI